MFTNLHYFLLLNLEWIPEEAGAETTTIPQIWCET